MKSAVVLAREGHRLLQLGIALILFSSLEAFVVPHLASQRIALSVHTLSAFEGVLLLALGLMWSRLELGTTACRVAFWCLAYSALAILAAYGTAAFWGVGNETIRLMGELPHGLVRGTAFQETLIQVLAYSSAPPFLISFVLIFWGLRVDGGRDATT
jgi:hydroxylaminobenzene mutase